MRGLLELELKGTSYGRPMGKAGRGHRVCKYFQPARERTLSLESVAARKQSALSFPVPQTPSLNLIYMYAP
jgi:hypothetical protein